MIVESSLINTCSLVMYV